MPTRARDEALARQGMPPRRTPPRKGDFQATILKSQVDTAGRHAAGRAGITAGFADARLAS